MRVLGGTAATLLVVVATPLVALANGSHLIPPPPPPPFVCSNACSGPPPPPTLVPTAEPTLVAPRPFVAVKVMNSRIARGHVARVSVEASTHDAVTIQVFYRHSKPTTWHGKIGDRGTVVRAWKVPKKAPVGLGVVKVTVTGSAGKIQRIVPFLVTR